MRIRPLIVPSTSWRNNAFACEAGHYPHLGNIANRNEKVITMSSLPALFVSHGSPMLALAAGTTGDAWKRVALGLPRPSAILMISAHWGSLQPTLSLATQPDTIHDFGGFPAELFAIQYPAPGAPALAETVAALLKAGGLPVAFHPSRGLDHGAWVPLREMYPAADIPVVQLSLQPKQDAAYHYRLGQLLAPLRENNVLVIASGSLTHNLYEAMQLLQAEDARTPPYVSAFQAWMFDHLQSGDLAALLDYRVQAPEAVRAHPTDEHLLPLYVALGAGGIKNARREHNGIEPGGLAMDMYAFG